MRLTADLYLNEYEDRLRKKYVAAKIVRYFPNTFIGNGHLGLSKIAAREGVNISKLDPGEYVIFVNKAQTALKMFCMGRVIAHLKMPEGTKLDSRVIALLPRFFNGKSIDYDSAIRRVLQAELG